MKKITLSPSFKKKLNRLKKKNAKLFQKVKQQFLLFEFNQQHPSLRLHKLKGDMRNVWSLSVTTNIRILFVEDEKYYFFDIGTHDQMYKK